MAEHYCRLLVKDPSAFIRANTQLSKADGVPELKLWLATEVTSLWQATEAWLESQNCAPPYWAFAWAGGKGLARYLLDHPDICAGKRVVDFATGSGIAAIAAAKAGAAHVTATEVDALAIEVTMMNALANGVIVDARKVEIDDEAFQDADIIIAADICYEPAMTTHLISWLRKLAVDKMVILADPGRAYLPKTGLDKLADYIVPTTFDLENITARLTTIYQLHP